MRCEHCKGSGLADKQGPDDDELLGRVVLQAILIDEMRTEIEQLRRSCGEDPGTPKEQTDSDNTGSRE